MKKLLVLDDQIRSIGGQVKCGDYESKRTLFGLQEMMFTNLLVVNNVMI